MSIVIPGWLFWGLIFIFILWCLRVESGFYIPGPTIWMIPGLILFGVWITHSVKWVWSLFQ